MTGTSASAGSGVVSAMLTRVYYGEERIGVWGSPWGSGLVGVFSSGLDALVPGSGPAGPACVGCLLCIAAALSLPDVSHHPQYACTCSIVT